MSTLNQATLVSNAQRMLSNLSLLPDEAERIAYISGNVAEAARCAFEQDIEDMAEAHDDELKEAKDEAFESGRVSGMEHDAQTEIEDLKAAAVAHERTLEAHKTLIKSIYALFADNALRLAPARKDHQLRIKHAARSLGVWL